MPEQTFSGPVEQMGPCQWRLPRSYRPDMRVDGLVFADDELMASIRHDQALEQVANVACLPGIVRASLAMPDIHWGYGFCIGGVAATDPEQGGVISPGGVGYDINCGVRLIRTDIALADARDRIPQIVDTIYEYVPAGVGGGGAVRFKRPELERILAEGSPYVVSRGYGWKEDLELTEAGGGLRGAKPDFVSERAYQRGADQCGSLGAGNHFLEVQVVEQVFEPAAAAAMGLAEGMLTVMIHSGSRGLGYQICEDALHELRGVPERYGISLPDRQLVCAPVHSPEGARYLGQMRSAANYAWANRQMIMHLTRLAFERVFGTPAGRVGLHLVYDVAHNIAKLESYDVGGTERPLCIHRKGATRAFPPDHPEVPAKYREVGQPVLIPGDMGRASYVLVGRPGAMTDSFGSSCHGAGRVMSRGAATRAAKGRSIHKELLAAGVYARAHSRKGLDEEQPDAYKDVSRVVDVVHKAGLTQIVAKLRPVGVVKG
ncbi:MAG: RtcB family protein [Planctomycetes bacterium]|nr:RtcB family protein [Planctomycetota bacterium]